MKISKLIIPDFQQFKNFELDLTYPTWHKKAGLPLDKVCFIGRNGTGKSTLLRLINTSLISMSERVEKNGINEWHRTPIDGDNIKATKKIIIWDEIILKIQKKEKTFYYFCNTHLNSNKFYFSENIEKEPEWIEGLSSEKRIKNIYNKKYSKYTQPGKDFRLKDNSQDLVIYSPSESSENQLLGLNDVPQTILNEALDIFNDFIFNHEVSNGTVKEFWKLLIYLIKKRENERDEFENKEENINKTKKELIDEFEKTNPQILFNLANLWNKILDKAGLEFDYKNASNPIQLNDNLKAYIKLKSSNNGERINYNELSTGIRNFIFRLGYIYALYFNRKIENGLLLVDEPENSLYPDFLYDLINTYLDVVKNKNKENNTQFFVATHSPIIAAQFEPEERIILDFDENGFVTSHRGITPVGDDPNDILENDFAIRSILGEEGIKMWEKYLDLKKQLIKAKNKAEKESLISQINKIGDAYNFEA